MMPELREFEMQCLQVLTVIPNEWVQAKVLEELIGDTVGRLREKEKRAKIAISSLVEKHILQGRMIFTLICYTNLH